MKGAKVTTIKYELIPSDNVSRLKLSSAAVRKRRQRRGRNGMLLLGGLIALLMISTLLAACFLWRNSTTNGATTAAIPTQVHVALMDQTTSTHSTRLGMTISWATDAKTNSSTVKYGLRETRLTSTVHAKTPCEQYMFCNYTSPWLHHVTIEGKDLLPETTYYYQCGDEQGGWSGIKMFTTPASAGSVEPQSFGIVGDLGQTEYSKQTLQHLKQHRDLRVLIHAGDLSYANGNQTKWDTWAELVEPLASRVPWMVAAGNHEQETLCQSDVDPFTAYQHRFRMPYNSTDILQQENLYYGFRVGMVHVIVLTPYVKTLDSSLQFRWLKQELNRVDRQVTPWLVVVIHGPWYSSNLAHQADNEENVDAKNHMEQLLYQHHVDIVVSGHVHAYERTLPVFKQKVHEKDGIVYVVMGSSGNQEGLAATFVDPRPEWSAARYAKYGYAMLHVHSATHAKIEVYANAELEGEKPMRYDEAWVTTVAYRMEETAS